jgi:hypothetical protein
MTMIESLHVVDLMYPMDAMHPPASNVPNPPAYNPYS